MKTLINIFEWTLTVVFLTALVAVTVAIIF